MSEEDWVFLYWDEPVWNKDEKNVKPKNKEKNDKPKNCTSREKSINQRQTAFPVLSRNTDNED